MAEDKPPRYYRVHKGRAFWEPGKFGQEYGFEKCVRLGQDGADAKAAALKFNEKLDLARRAKRDGIELTYPLGSLGAFYATFKETEAWALMEPATRAMYERAWPTIEKRFGATVVTKITADMSERFHVDLHPQHTNRRDPQGKLKLSWFQAHLVLKHWRLLLGALVSYQVIPAPAPIGRVSNPTPPSRTAVWTDEEVREGLIPAAIAMKEPGMALAILIGWETMMSTVDVRLLTIGTWRAAGEGQDAGAFETRRAKSGAIVRVASTAELDAGVAAYIAAHRQGADAAAALLLRGGTGEPFKDRHAFKQVFANVRERAFPGDRRQFGDMRRSGATEAKLGDVDDRDLGKAMANRLADDEGLQSTYIVAASKKVQEARKAGRDKHSAQFRKSKK